MHSRKYTLVVQRAFLRIYLQSTVEEIFSKPEFFLVVVESMNIPAPKDVGHVYEGEYTRTLRL
jgi:hypothetical protein